MTMQPTNVNYEVSLFPRDVYIPAHLIDYGDETGVSLRLSKGDLHHEKYGIPPLDGV